MTVTANRPRNSTTTTPRRASPPASATKRNSPGGLKPGHTYYLGEEAGVPHKFRPIFFRLASVEVLTSTPEGMVWVTGHEVDPNTGRLGEFRDVLAIRAGILPALGHVVSRPVI